MTADHSNLNHPHDTGYKYLLSSKKAFVKLIRSFIKAGWAENILTRNMKADKKKEIVNILQEIHPAFEGNYREAEMSSFLSSV